MTVYLVLCVLASMTAAQEGIPTRRSTLIGMIFSVLYACTDEWHQHYVPGRHGALRDVIIDSIGIITGFILMHRTGMLRTMEQTSHPSAERALEGDLWTPGREWELAVADIAQRFARVRPLDPDAVLAAESFQHQIAALQDWAGHDLDWSRDLTRFFDGHLSLYIKPDPAVSRSIRAHAAEHGPITIRTALPESAAWSLIHHLGIARSVGTITA